MSGAGGELAGRVALVTGASRNIGAAVALRLAADGAAVAVNHRGEPEAAAAVTARIAANGGIAAAFEADVADERAVTAMAEAVTDRLGPPTLLVNNAATAVVGGRPWHELTAREWDETLRVNVTGAFLCARALHPTMAAAGRGDVVSMSSVTALLGRTGNLHYVSSKAALIGFTRALARELGPEGIRVNALVVGAIRTPQEAAYGPPEQLDAMLAEAQALPRRGLPEDVAGAVSLLVSPRAGFVTGQCLTVDGGWVMT